MCFRWTFKIYVLKKLGWRLHYVFSLLFQLDRTGDFVLTLHIALGSPLHVVCDCVKEQWNNADSHSSNWCFVCSDKSNKLHNLNRANILTKFFMALTRTMTPSQVRWGNA